jgi:hypothetical protein
MIPTEAQADLLSTISLPIQQCFLTRLLSTLLFCPLLRLSRSLQVPYDLARRFSQSSKSAFIS